MTAEETNHRIIMCSLENRAEVEALAKEKNLPEFSELESGYHIVTIMAWLSTQINCGSKDIVEIMGTDGKKRDLVKTLSGLIRDSIVRVRELKSPVVYGGNILLRPRERILQSEVVTALSVLESGSDLNKFLSGICDKHYSINYLDQARKNVLADLIKLITFPVPSVYSLIRAMGYQYLTNDYFLSKGVVVGVVNAEQRMLYCGYGNGKFKILKYPMFCMLAAKDLLTEPITPYESTDLEIITNHMA